MKRILEGIRSTKWLQIVISILTFVLGLFAKPMLDSRVKPLFSPANIPVTVFLLVSLLFAVIIAIWINTHQQIVSVANHTGILAKYVGQRAHILSHVQGYDEVRKRTQTASTEVLKLIYYEVSSTTGKPVYDGPLLESSVRKSTYIQEREKLQRERGTDKFAFVEIVQIPYGYDLERVLPHDPVYKESCEFLARFSRTEPEFARLCTSDVIFPNTFIIIDRSFLYIAFQTKNPDTGSYEYPFLGLVIEDPDSEVIRDMLKLYYRIEANSKLFTGITKINNESLPGQP